MFGKRIQLKLPPIRLRVLIMVLILLVGFVPVILKGAILSKIYRQTLLDGRKNEIQNQSLILSARLTRSGYLRSAERDASLNAEMDATASAYNGRILLIDQNYRVIRDSFQLAEGRYHVAPEVIRGFRGENGLTYNAEQRYMIQTTPVYSRTLGEEENSSRTVEGVLLFLASTEALRAQLRNARNSQVIMDSVFFLLLLSLSIVVSGLIMRPFIELRTSVGQVSNGDLNQSISQNTYLITKQLSDELNTTIRRLRDADQSRDEFVANVSHELKTPITSIRVLADSLMSMDDVPVELYKEFMNDISKEIDREAKIIDDLLNLVKMDRSGVVLNRTSVDMNAMLEQILKRLRPQAKLRNIEMTLETVRDVKADVDEVKFSLAITNLVENAIKYNVDGGWVHVSLDADHQFCYIKVEDNGIGIPEDQQDNVFERFYRVDKARSRETGGTGLGLAITRNIILLHQGIIRLTSKEGEGSSFLVRIPLVYIEKGSAADLTAAETTE
ncbi:MAG: ATP-binding protein [Stomatobaculum sp.]|nr:ATP-binding protein [Stomatobaculum sp.]